jgi:hypothetical protein
MTVVCCSGTRVWVDCIALSIVGNYLKAKTERKIMNVPILIIIDEINFIIHLLQKMH